MFVETKTITLLAPELVLMLGATLIFVGGAFVRNRLAWAAVAKLLYIVAGGLLLSGGLPTDSTLSGPIVVDALGFGMRGLAIAMGLIFTAVVAKTAAEELASEFIGLLMLVTLGAMITSVANDLVLFFLGLELISIPTYVLLFLGRKDRASGEATMKYFFLSLLSSGLLLYGLSFLYGLGGTTTLVGNSQISGIREALAAGSSPATSLAPLALVLIMAGMAFKLAAVPFQFYAPDVYQGTTNANAGLLAVAPKIAGVAGLIRIVLVTMHGQSEFAWQIALIMAVLSMTIGNICALWQTNIRRMLAYSSIAHGGYLLIGIAVACGSFASGQGVGGGGIAATLLYLAMYAIASMGTFAILTYLGSAQREVNSIEDLAGLGKSEPLASGMLAIFMFSFAGIPPLAGFWGKFTLFSAAIQLAIGKTAGSASGWFLLLAIVAAVNAAIGAAYYLRIISVLFFSPGNANNTARANGGIPALAAGTVCGIMILLAGLTPGAFAKLAGEGEKGVRPKTAPVAVDVKPAESGLSQVIAIPIVAAAE